MTGQLRNYGQADKTGDTNGKNAGSGRVRDGNVTAEDYTQAALRALKDALWRNSVNVAELFGFPKESMIIDAEIGVQQPEKVDTDALKSIFPYGHPNIRVTQGGLDIDKPHTDGRTVIANAAVIVSFDMEPAK